MGGVGMPGQVAARRSDQRRKSVGVDLSMAEKSWDWAGVVRPKRVGRGRKLEREMRRAGSRGRRGVAALARRGRDWLERQLEMRMRLWQWEGGRRCAICWARMPPKETPARWKGGGDWRVRMKRWA